MCCAVSLHRPVRLAELSLLCITWRYAVATRPRFHGHSRCITQHAWHGAAKLPHSTTQPAPAGSAPAQEQHPRRAAQRHPGAPSALHKRRPGSVQKCVRRRLAREAGRLAHALLAAAPADALRRVAVMCIEDAALHPRLPAVVWMMMAVAKGFALTADHCALAVRVVWDLAQARVRDTLPERQAAAATGTAPPAISHLTVWNTATVGPASVGACSAGNTR